MGQENLGLLIPAPFLTGLNSGLAEKAQCPAAGSWKEDFFSLLCALLGGPKTAASALELSSEGTPPNPEEGLAKKAALLSLAKQSPKSAPPLPAQGSLELAPTLAKEEDPTAPAAFQDLWQRLSMVLMASGEKAAGKGRSQELSADEGQEALVAVWQGLCQKLVLQEQIHTKEAPDGQAKPLAILTSHPKRRKALVSLLQNLEKQNPPEAFLAGPKKGLAGSPQIILDVPQEAGETPGQPFASLQPEAFDEPLPQTYLLQDAKKPGVRKNLEKSQRLSAFPLKSQKLLAPPSARANKLPGAPQITEAQKILSTPGKAETRKAFGEKATLSAKNALQGAQAFAPSQGNPEPSPGEPVFSASPLQRPASEFVSDQALKAKPKASQQISLKDLKASTPLEGLKANTLPETAAKKEAISRPESRAFVLSEAPKPSFKLDQKPHATPSHHAAHGLEEATAVLNTADAKQLANPHLTPGGGSEAPGPIMRLMPAQVPAYVKEFVLRPGRQGHHEARIKLEPPHLGEVHISVSIDRGEVKLLFTVEHPQAAQALHQELHHLAQALSEAGLQLGGCEIGLGGGQGQAFQEEAPRQNWWQPGANSTTLEVPEQESRPLTGQGLIDVRI